jgi:hypothetical protein
LGAFLILCTLGACIALLLVLWLREKQLRTLCLERLSSCTRSIDVQRAGYEHQLAAVKDELDAVRSVKNLAEARLEKAERPRILKANSWGEIRRLNQQENERQAEKEIAAHDDTNSRTGG